MQTHELKNLEYQIEQLVKSYINACVKSAHAAIERALSDTQRADYVKPKRDLRPMGEAQKPNKRYRSRADIEQIISRMEEYIIKEPGVTMAALAMELGAKALDLQRPMALLRERGRVQKAGTRHFTRYYPVAINASVAA